MPRKKPSQVDWEPTSQIFPDVRRYLNEEIDAALNEFWCESLSVLVDYSASGHAVLNLGMGNWDEVPWVDLDLESFFASLDGSELSACEYEAIAASLQRSAAHLLGLAAKRKDDGDVIAMSDGEPKTDRHRLVIKEHAGHPEERVAE